MFLTKVAREKRIPFEINADPFYSAKNMLELRNRIESINNGTSVLKEYELIEDLDQCVYCGMIKPSKNILFVKTRTRKHYKVDIGGNMYKVEKTILNKSVMNELIDLSKVWMDEAISYGIVINTKEDFIGKDIYVAYNNRNKIIGYLMCSYFEENKQTPTIPLGSKVCYVDEIYVVKKYRSKGIGSLLFEKMKNDIKDKCDYIEVCTSTKDHKKIMHFYEDILDMNFWSAMFFKKIS